MAGMDVYLRYSDLSKSKNSSFYVVRNSHRKYKDNIPQLIPTEIEYLQSLSDVRSIVIFDEDISSGTTMGNAHRYFKDIFPDKYRLITLANIRGYYY